MEEATEYLEYMNEDEELPRNDRTRGKAQIHFTADSENELMTFQ
jgi:hypothetical protein